MDSSWRESETTTLGERLFPTDEAFPDQLKLIRYRMQLTAGMVLLVIPLTFIIDLLSPPKYPSALWAIRITALVIQLGFFLAFKLESLSLPKLMTMIYADYLILSVGLAAMLIAGEQPAMFTMYQPLAVSMLLLPISGAQATTIQAVIFGSVLSLALPAARIDEMRSKDFIAALLTYAVLVVIVRAAAGMTYKLRISEAKSRDSIEEAMRRLNYLSSFDHLTRVANRSNFESSTEAAVLDARAMHHSLAYLEVDLDYFKRINDELGHQAGDAVLRAASERIAGCLRTGDQVGRMGGDEFAVLIIGATVEVATTVADRILSSFRASRLKTSWGEIELSCSVGVAWYSGTGPLSSNAIMAAADESLYEAKEAGRGRVGSVKAPLAPETTLSGEFPMPGTASFSGEYATVADVGPPPARGPVITEVPVQRGEAGVPETQVDSPPAQAPQPPLAPPPHAR